MQSGASRQLDLFGYILFMVVDIDECREPSICGPNANCTNQPSTYMCSCMQGYESKDNNTLNCTGTKSLIKFLSQIRGDGNPSPNSKGLERQMERERPNMERGR